VVRRYLTKFTPDKIVLYITFGLVASCVDYGIFLISFAGTANPYVANIVGISSGIIVSFLLNRTYNFRKFDFTAQRWAKFTAVALYGMVLSSYIIMLLVVTWQIDPRLAKLIAMAIVSMGQFAANATWTFR